MVLRPVLQPAGASEAEHREAAAIVEAHAQASLAAFTQLPDKTLFFSPSRRSLVAYGARGRGAIALGNPVGPAEERRETIAAFRDHCFGNDWQPAFYQTLPDHLDLYRELGFRTLKIGEEGIVDLAAFSLKGKAAGPLRTPLNKLRKLGHSVEVHGAPLGDPLIEELRPISREWLQRMKGAEKMFSLGWFDPDYLRGTEIALVRTPAGAISAFASLLVGVRPGEVAIDLMRSRTDLEPGTMDVLFISLLQHDQEAGFSRFNLGLSALSGLGDSQESPRLEKAMAGLADHLDRFCGAGAGAAGCRGPAAGLPASGLI
ncbi:bifunctional lysylphosphatidylglycerol flippase/synthetase MprF [Synechococcus sp. CCY 9618]|uniref:bifunctional lysylphosphatidylglycerol flippase/synthetase MprF n=1 Tax=Synechococcus sp. CCY 9618 TaxID=2815602 RepID=UPI001C248FAD|nr:phosphatidylglycerol lysyltransferase domain-containing protein [Synechococcus sp. CCY 9618]